METARESLVNEDPFREPETIPVDDDSGSSFAPSDGGSIEGSGSQSANVNRRRSSLPAFSRNSHTTGSSQRQVSPAIQCESNGELSTKADIETGQVHANAVAWAAAFSPPELEAKTPDEVPDATVREYDSRNVVNYEYLLSSLVTDIATQGAPELTEIEGSQIGASFWTASEKEAFFTALGRLGKDNPRAIARRIGTKSALEVRQYLKLLGEVSVQNQDIQRLSQASMPAAAEISERCNAMLGQLSDELTNRGEQEEVEAEKITWGENWLLTEDNCKNLEVDLIDTDSVDERSGSGSDDDEDATTEAHTSGEDTPAVMEDDLSQSNLSGADHIEETLRCAIEHLNLNNWLVVQERIFMNAGHRHREDNYSVLAQPGEKVGIRANAFNIFYEEMKAITTLLIQHSSRLARARIDSTPKRTERVPQPEVKHRDVAAAVQALNLRHDSKDFWRKTARRCRLDVVESAKWNNYSVQDGHATISYSRVERLLGMDHVAWGQREEGLKSKEWVSSEDDGADDHEGPENHVSSWSKTRFRPSTATDDIGDEDRIFKTHSSTSEPPEGHRNRPGLQDDKRKSSHFVDQVRQDIEEDLLSLDADKSQLPGKDKDTRHQNERALVCYSHLLDAKNSMLEEQVLWNSLQGASPCSLEPAELEVPDEPQPMKKDADDFIDWRRRLRYLSPWEMFAEPVPATHSDPKGQSRRKITSNVNARAKSSHTIKASNHKDTRPSEVHNASHNDQAPKELVGEEIAGPQVREDRAATKEAVESVAIRQAELGESGLPAKSTSKKRGRPASQQSSAGSTRAKKRRKVVSAEFVVDSDDEEM